MQPDHTPDNTSIPDIVLNVIEFLVENDVGKRVLHKDTKVTKELAVD